MKNLEELRATSLEICEDLERLSAIARPTAGELERLSRQIVAAERVAAKILDLEERDAKVGDLRSIVTDPSKRSWIGDGAPGDSPEHLRRGEVYDPPITARTTKNDLESRALRALDSLDYADRDKVEKLVRTKKGRADAEYVIVASDPSYSRAFSKMLKDPQYGSMSLEPEEQRAFAAAHNSEVRAALSTAGANGGFLIPFHLDPNVILTNVGTVNPFRAISRVETLVNSNVWHGVSSAGVVAEWTSEAAEMTDASPSFAQPSITPIRADAYIEASWEVVEDAVSTGCPTRGAVRRRKGPFGRHRVRDWYRRHAADRDRVRSRCGHGFQGGGANECTVRCD